MNKPTKTQCQRESLKCSLICATLGLSMAVLLVLLMLGVGEIVKMLKSYLFLAPTAVAIVVLYATAVSLSRVAGSFICRIGVHGLGVWLIGIGLAECCLILAVLISSSMNLVSELHNEPNFAVAFMDWIVKPAYWVLLFGTLPALVLGLLYAVGVRKALG